MPVKFVFSDPMLQLWMLFHQTYNSIFKYEDKEFAKVGTTPQQHGILMSIRQNGGSINPSTLANWLERDANSITLIIDRMEKTGFVKRDRDKVDRRVLNITLTRKGEKTLADSSKTGAVVVKEMTKKLSKNEVSTLLVLLDKMREPAVSKTYPGEPIKELKAGTPKKAARPARKVKI
jgi:DNA-binding MarR family transcriptional regulator